MPTNVKEPVQLKRPQGKKLPIDKSVWEQAEQVGILYSSDTQSRLGSKSKRKKKTNKRQEWIPADLLFLSCFACFSLCHQIP